MTEVIKICKRCGKPFTDPHRTKYCGTDCYKEAQLLIAHARYECKPCDVSAPIIHRSEWVNKNCEMCGEMMFNVSQWRRFCVDCAKERAAAGRKNKYELDKLEGKAKRKEKKHKGVTIEEACRIAKEAGLSYGQAHLRGLF